MSKTGLLAGVAALGLVVASTTFVGTLWAQEAGQAPQPAAQDCSGLGCLFGSRSAPAARSAAETQALQDNQRAAEAAAAEESSTPKSKSKRSSRKVAAKSTTSKTSQPTTAAAANAPAQPQNVAAAPDTVPAPVKKATRPARTVTIAADAPEAKRLEQIVAALPKEKIKIVKPAADGEKTKADFAVTTKLDQSAGADTTKLFTEQLHIVADASIKSVADLDGKVVSFGPDKSPGQAAARKAFEALHVKVAETPLDIDNALDGLTTGDVKAVVMLAPQPIDRLKSVSASGVHLVSWPEGGSLPDGASSATIDAGAYPTLAKPGETIRAVGVDAMLVMSPTGAKGSAARSFLKSLSQHAEILTKRGFDLSKASLDPRNTKWMAITSKFSPAK